jgi:uncharacterized protein involved in outer membrane biogenesis
MPLSKTIRRILYVLGGLVALLMVLLVIISLVQIPIDLTDYKGIVEAAASRAVGRTMKIDGKIQVTTSLWPSFQMEGLRLTNPKGFQAENFAMMKSAKAQVSVLPLLLGKIHIKQFSVKGVAVALEENKEGAVSWVTHMPEKSTKKKKEQKEPEPKPKRVELTSDSFVLTKLELEDISVSYQEHGMAKPFEFKIDKCTGSGLVGKPLTLLLQGTLLNHSFTSTIEVGSLEELLKENKSWMEIGLEIAKTQFELAGNLDLSQVTRTLQVQAAVKGDSLDSLNRLMGFALPPFKSYGASGRLSMRRDRIDLSDFKVYISESKLEGKTTITSLKKNPVVTIDLTAPMIQLNDFDLKGWSPEGDESKPQAKEKAVPAKRVRPEGESISVSAGPEEGGDREVLDLFDPEVLARADAQMKVAVKKVLSGKDDLGSGNLTATLRGGRLSIDPIKLNLPGGSLFFALSLKPGREASEASIRVEVKNFDFGVIARRAKPETDLGGTLNLDVDLKSSAKTLSEFLANSNGYLDFSGTPENLQAGIIDLWAVNLFAAIVSKSEDKSKINCLVCRLSMKDGLLTSDTFVIDTSRIRICGKGKVNFKEERVHLIVRPTPKKPEYFSLATPIAVKGKFSDFKVGIEKGGLIGTSLSFITSPIHATMRRVAGEKLPKEGGDVCGMTIGPDNRPTEPPLGCGRPAKTKRK